jgi:hypothetical protein
MGRVFGSGSESEKKQAILAQLVEFFVLCDSSVTHRIKRPDAFRKLLSICLTNRQFYQFFQLG